MICPKCGAETDGLYLNGCFKCLIKPPPKESEKREGSEKAGQENCLRQNNRTVRPTLGSWEVNPANMRPRSYSKE